MNTELVTLNDEQYPALADGGAILTTIKQNLGNDEISPSDLTRIKVPLGGSETWLVPGIGGETAHKTLDGVMVHTARRRAWWPGAGLSKDPPMCASADCVTGIGEPGGPCTGCPHDEWGSAVKDDGSSGRGKACKVRRLIFLLLEGKGLPVVVDCPPSSLGSVKAYLLALSGAGLGYPTVQTRFSLRKSENKDGEPHAIVVPTMLHRLSEETTEQVLAYAEKLADVFAATGVEPDEVETEKV